MTVPSRRGEGEAMERCAYCDGAGYLERVKPNRHRGSLVKCLVCDGAGRVAGRAALAGEKS